MTDDNSIIITDDNSIRMIDIPSPTWEMKLGDLTISHVKPINWWQRFWLRFMGWEVNVFEAKQ